MKQLKCENCGATIKVTDENNDFAECPYCKAKYQLNERKDIYIRMDDNTKEILTNSFGRITKQSKFVMIPVLVFALIMIIVIISMMVGHFSDIKKTSESIDDEYQKFDRLARIWEKENVLNVPQEKLDQINDKIARCNRLIESHDLNDLKEANKLMEEVLEEIK